MSAPEVILSANEIFEPDYPKRRLIPSANLIQIYPYQYNDKALLQDILKAWKEPTPTNMLLMNVSPFVPSAARGPTDKKEEDELVDRWIKVIEQPGADGIIVDELQASPDYYPYWISAIRRVRAAHPTKLQAVWLASGISKEAWALQGGTTHDKKTSDFIKELHYHTEYVIPELYLAQQQVIQRLTTGTASLDFSLLSYVIEQWCARLGEDHILQRCVIGIGAFQDHGFTTMQDSSGNWVSRTLNDAPDMSYSSSNPQLKLSYGEFLAKQVDYCASHPLLSKALGVAIWSPNYITYDNLVYLNNRLRLYMGS